MADPRSTRAAGRSCRRTPRSPAAPRRVRRARRCRPRPSRTRAAGAPRTGAGSRWPRAPARAPGRSRRGRVPSLREPSLVSRCASVLAVWFERMRAAMPRPSNRMIAVDCPPASPRASSKIATTESAAQADTTDTLVSTGRAQRRGAATVASSRLPVNSVHAANASGPSMNGSSIEGIVPSNVPRVQCHPNVAVAAAVHAKMPNSARCRRVGAHRSSAPKAAICVAVIMLKMAAVIDA